ncbi:MAG: hypothetical protein LC791_16050, partial [Acidobacteria bacterium]|nr:hypothetical protein [Acidobacteriota bacterium]
GRATPWLAVAAGIALLMLAGWQLLPVDRSSGVQASLAALADSAAADHRDCALDHTLREPVISLQDAARRYNPAYAGLSDLVVQSDALRSGGFELAFAHWCILDGRHFGHIVLQREATLVSLLLTPDESLNAEETGAATACPSSRGFHVACFAAPGHAIYVVSELTDAENLELARGLAPALRAHLARA